MGKPSIIYQTLNNMRELIKFGESKYEAKLEGRAHEGIYSFKTYETYVKEALEFAEWARETHGCKNLAQARQYVEEYLKSHIERGDSSWSVRVEASALAKLYRCSTRDFNVELPKRSRESIERSRLEREHDKEFSQEKNRDLIIFAKATGLRRRELERIRADDIYRKGDRLYVHVENGKGGREREVHVLQKYEKEVERIVEERKDSDRLFERIPVRMDVHAYRREYAQERYRELEREIQERGREYVKERVREHFRRYLERNIEDEREREEKTKKFERELERDNYRRRDGREFDRTAIMGVSQDLGHNRADVVANYYLE